MFCSHAVQSVDSIVYVGVGTVEFVVDSMD